MGEDVSFRVKTNHFEGPLDLLLALIEKRKLHISEISLARIADDYLEYIEQMEEFPVRDTAHFLVVASTLVLIKSRSLLPTLSLTEEEEETIGDLEIRLKTYQYIRSLGKHIHGRFGERVLFAREIPRTFEPVFTPTQEITQESLLQAIQSVIQHLPRAETIPQVVVRKAVSLEEMMENLSERISRALSLSFKEFSHMGKGEKVDVVIGFLAILELVKRGLIDVSQEEQFGDIQMERAEIGMPKYY